MRITRGASAPAIDVFESRSPDGGYGTRRVVLAISNASQDLLNGQLLAPHELTSQHVFSPACSINLVESLLREEFEKYVANGFGNLHLGKAVEDPEALLQDHDVVFVAGGRHYPCEEWREPRGMQVRQSRPAQALILKYQTAAAGEVRPLNDVQALLSRFEAKEGPLLFIRPGATEQEGWLWVVGLTADIAARAREELERRCDNKFSSFLEMWFELTRKSATGGKTKRRVPPGLLAAFKLLDKELKPASVSARVSEAAFWHSDTIVRRVEKADGSIGWIVLVGDSACGRPFYLGSTLNGHFQDTPALCSAPWKQWSQAALPGAQPFKRYVEQYRRRTDATSFRGT